MWKRLSLRVRIFLVLTALILTSLGGSLVTIWHTNALDLLFSTLIDKNIASSQAAAGLEIALLRQKGYLTYYFLDGDPDWLDKLAHYRHTFREWLLKARQSTYDAPMKEILDKIETQYASYLIGRNEVIKLYKAGQREAGAKLHWEVRKQFLEIYDLCEQYKLIQAEKIARTRIESRRQARFINTLAMIVMLSVVALSIWLGYILLKQLLEPIGKLAYETGPAANEPREANEVKVLSRRVHSLIENVDQTQSKLARSQEHLLQSEKLAMVGKLAAGVSHSIRNPLTSVKMRLFSMRRTLDLTPTQQEDLEVIYEEIRHIDTILRNFLEFSRPPRPKMQNVSPSDVVDMALQLLRQRLESYQVQVKLARPHRLPEMWGDPDQLKEVLINLLVNAYEAMPGGGLITITEEENFIEGMGPAAVIKVSDNGSGIPESIQDKIFQPFFSNKEEGTGLGLSIASRIITEHGGWLELESLEGKGATFIITLPRRDNIHGYYTNS